jgi:hypothetical protein
MKSRAKTKAARANATLPRGPRAGDWITGLLMGSKTVWVKRARSADAAARFDGTPNQLRAWLVTNGDPTPPRFWVLDPRGRYARVAE